MKNIDDHELQRQLQQVSVPTGLQERLKKISQQDGLAIVSESTRNAAQGKLRKRTVAWQSAALALVAALTAIGVYALWPSDFQPATPLSSGSGIATREQPIPEPVPIASRDPQRLLDELSESAVQIDQVAMQIKIQQMERRLAKLSQRERHRTRGIQQRDATSLVLTLSDESAIRLGAKRSNVQRDLNYVVDKFPGTLGAELARKILSTEL